MKQYLHDFSRGFFSTSTLAILVTLVGLSTFAAVTDQPTPAIGSFVYYYEGGFHILLYVGDESGRPVPGAAWSLRIIQIPNSPPHINNSFSIAHPLPNATINTSSNGQGLARVFVNLTTGNYSVSGSVSTALGVVPESWVISSNEGRVIKPGPDTIQPDRIGFFSTKPGLFVMCAGSNESYPVGYEVKIAFLNSSSNPPSYRPSNLTSLGAVSGYANSVPLPSNFSRFNQSQELYVEVLGPSGNITDSSFLGITPFRGVLGATGQASRSADYLVGYLPAVIAGLSVGLAYVSYGRERTSRSLEPVHSKPVTHWGLLLNRYLMSLATIVFVVGCGVLGYWSMFRNYWHVALPLVTTLSLVGSYLIEAGAILGFCFLLARLTFSQGKLVGLSVGALLTWILGCQVIATAMPLSTSTVGGTWLWGVFLAWADPAAIPQVILAIDTSQLFGLGLTSGSVIVPAVPALAFVGIFLWAVLPASAAAWQARQLD